MTAKRSPNPELELAAKARGKLAQVGITAKLFPAQDNEGLLRAAAAVTTGYVVSKAIDIEACSAVTLLVKLTSTAAGDVVSIIPEVCSELDSENFFPIAEAGTASIGNLSSAPVGNFSADQFSIRTYNPAVIKTPAVATNAHTIGLHATVNVPFGRKFRVQVRGDVGTPVCEILAIPST